MYGVAEHFQHFMQTGPPLLEWALFLFVVAPPATLLHELGHAVVARRRLPGRVRIRVGPDPALAQFTLGGIEFHLRPLLKPVGVTGVCEYEAGGLTANDAIAISLAGPTASLFGTLVSALMLGSARPGSVWHGLLWQATMMQGLSTIICLTPLRLRSNGRTMGTDGLIALDAFRRRFLWQPMRVPAAAPASAAPVARPLPSAPAPSAACARCSHPVDEHVNLATGGPGSCLGQDYDFQTLTPQPCGCAGFVSGN